MADWLHSTEFTLSVAERAQDKLVFSTLVHCHEGTKLHFYIGHSALLGHVSRASHQRTGLYQGPARLPGDNRQKRRPRVGVLVKRQWNHVASAKHFFVMHVQPWILNTSVSNHSFSQFV